MMALTTLTLVCFVLGQGFRTLHCLPLLGLDMDVITEDFYQPQFQLWSPNIMLHEVVKTHLQSESLVDHPTLWGTGMMDHLILGTQE